MDAFKEKLKVASWVIIILAIFNAVMLGINWKSGDLRKEAEARINQTLEENDVSEEEADDVEDTLSNVVFYTVVTLTILGVLFKLYLGVKGINQANGNVKGKGNIVWATIVLICCAISLGTSIMPMIRQEIEIPSVVSSACSLFIIAYYLVYASKVVKGVEAGEDKPEEKKD